VDGDGDLDLVTSPDQSGINLVNPVSVYLNQGRGTFTAGQTLQLRGTVLGLLDQDGDGDLDLLSSNYSTDISPIPRVLLNNGKGTFGPGFVSIASPLTQGGFITKIVFGDLNGDGRLDIVGSAGNYVVFSTLQRETIASGLNPVVGDLDGDGDLDLVAAYSESANVYVNQGDGTFTAGPRLSPYGLELALGDFDNDGDLDLLTGTQVYANNGAGAFTALETALTDPLIRPLVSDVDGDGDLDIVAANTAEGGAVSVYLNSGQARFTKSQVVATGTSQFTIGDVDGDGDVDILTASQVYLNQNVPTGPTLREPENPLGTVAGLDYAYYEAPSSYTKLPDFATSAPKKTGTALNFDVVSVRDRAFAYAIKYTGYVTVPTDGQYTFFTSSDDGSQFFIGSQLVVDNNGEHAVQERAGAIGLKAGTHAFTLTYFQSGGGENLRVSYQGPNEAKQPLPLASLHRVPTSNNTVAKRWTSSAAYPETISLQVYPNPSSGRFIVRYTATKAQAAILRLTDRLGRVVLEQQVQVQVGDNQLPVQVGGQAQGLYHLTFQPSQDKVVKHKVALQPEVQSLHSDN
jgi:hypothetical protein